MKISFNYEAEVAKKNLYNEVGSLLGRMGQMKKRIIYFMQGLFMPSSSCSVNDEN